MTQPNGTMNDKMNTSVYAIWDNQAEEYIGGLLLFRADAAALRAFGDIASDPNTQIARHVIDYELHRLAQYSSTTGTLHQDREVIITGERWQNTQREMREEVTSIG